MIKRYIRPEMSVVGGVCLSTVLGVGALASCGGSSASLPRAGKLEVVCTTMQINSFTSRKSVTKYEEGDVTTTIVTGDYSESQVKAYAVQAFLLGACDRALRQGMQVTINPLTVECDNLSSPLDRRAFNFDCSGIVSIARDAPTPVSAA